MIAEWDLSAMHERTERQQHGYYWMGHLSFNQASWKTLTQVDFLWLHVKFPTPVE